VIKTTNYGANWFTMTAIGGTVNTLHMYSKSILVTGRSDNYVFFSDNGGLVFNLLNIISSKVTNLLLNSYDELITVTSGKNLILSNVKGNTTATITSSYDIISMESLNDRNVIISTSNNNYLILNLTTQTIKSYYSPLSFITMVNNNNTIYGIGSDYLLYSLNQYQNGTLNLYNNNNLFGQYNNTRRLILPYLFSNNYNFRTELTYNNVTVSSNILQININPNLRLLTISDVLYSSNNIILNTSTDYKYIFGKTTFFNKINNNKLIGNINLIRFVNDNIIFTGGSNGLLNYSINRGINWQIIDTKINSDILSFYAWDISNILVITSNRIVKTINGGTTWYDVSGNFLNKTFTCGDIIDDTGYVGTNDGSIFKTFDFGNNWILVNSYGGNFTVLKIYNKNIIFTGRIDQYILYTLDSFRTYALFNTNVSIINDIIISSLDQIILLQNNNKNVAKFDGLSQSLTTIQSSNYILSLDMFNNSEILMSTYINQYIVTNLDSMVTTTYPSDVPLTKMKKYKTSVYGIDKYGNFYKLDTRIPGQIKIYDETNNLLLNTQYDEKIIINNLQSKPYELNGIIDTIETISSNILSLDLRANYSINTVSGIINTGPNTKIIVNSNYNYQINKSSFWNLISNSPLLLNPVNIKFYSDSIYYICGKEGKLICTFDGGVSWSSIKTNSLNNIINFNLIDISNIVLIFSNKISRTINGGLSWFDISGTPFFNKTLSSADSIEETIIVGTTDGYLYKSINYGNTWFQLTYLVTQINSLSMYNKSIYAFSGSNNYIYITRNNYENYRPILVSLVSNKIIFDSFNKIYYADNRTINIINYWSDGGAIVTSINNQTMILIDSSLLLFSCYSTKYGIIDLNNNNKIYLYEGPISFILFEKYKNSIYGIGSDYKFYKLNIRNPFNIDIYDNNTLISSSSYNDFIILNNLSSKNYNLIGYVNTISSNILPINTTINLNLSTLRS
jgi:photosystem II stability/assembly factor-like uncharacterized protein